MKLKITLLFLLLVLLVLLVILPGKPTLSAAATPAPATWRIEVDVPVMAQVISETGSIAAAQTVLQRQITGALSKGGVRSTITAETDSLRVTLEGNGGLDQFRQTVFVDLGKQLVLLGGPITLSLTGSVSASQDLQITLESNPSTGYGWEVVGGNHLETAGPTRFARGEGLIGAPQQQILSLKGLRSGTTTLSLAYRRHWENAPATRRIQINVDALPAAIDLSNPAPVKKGLSTIPSGQNVLPSVTPLRGLPSSFDWKAQGKMTPVKNQGGCGSCWAAATNGAVEAAIKIATGQDVDLSEQYLISCNTDGWGCAAGGRWGHDYYITKVGKNGNAAGAVLESDFPYTGLDSTACPTIANHPFKLTSWGYVSGASTIPSDAAMKAAIYTFGPINASLCVGSSFHNYTSGIFNTDESTSCGGYTNHAVVLTGWDDSTQSWVLRNSWGTGWGESGYMRIHYDISSVGSGAAYVVYGTPTVPNDEVSGALTATALPYSHTQYDVNLATTNASDPQTCTVGTFNTVWYKYTPSTTQTVRADTFTSTYDTVLAVYTGTLGSMTRVACNNDASDLITQSQVRFTANAGTTYYFMIAEANSPLSSLGTLVFNISPSSPSVADRIGIYNNGMWYLSNNNTTSSVSGYYFGGAGWTPVIGDWNNNGRDKIGIYNNGAWYLSNNNSTSAVSGYYFGGAGWLPVTGNWLGTGATQIGIYNNGMWYLSNDNTTSNVSAYYFGGAGWTPVVGDWNNSGRDKIGIYNNGAWYLSQNNSTSAIMSYYFGGSGWTPIVGDWNNTGMDKIGIYNNGMWYLSNNNTTSAVSAYYFGGSSWRPVVGSWVNAMASATAASPTAATPKIAPTFVPRGR